MFYFVYADDGAGIMDITEHKHVLIVNSYHQGLAWTKDESDGIIDTLSQSGANLSIYVEYMDWKDIPTEENMEHFYEYMKYKYQGKNIDVIIATDDSALSFALNNRAELFSNAPVVFCGVNQQGAAELTRGGSNYTGVIEEIDPTETVKMALSINPSLRNIYILFDNSESGVSTGEIVIEKIEGMKLNPIPLNKLTYEQLIRDVKSYDENSIILVTTYFSDVDGRIVEFDNVSREIGKNSSVPVYHLYEMGLDNGAFGGVMMSGRLQGENAAGLALRILGGEAADDIPVISPVTTRKVFDFQQLERFSVSIKDIPQDSEVLNKPFSFFGTYKAIVLSVLAVFIILLAFVFSLLYYISKIREMKRILSLNHEELSETYEELAASDEELQQQFDELSMVKDKLELSYERFRLATAGSNAIIWDVDMTNMQYYFSDRWYDLLGYKKGEIDEANSGWKTIIHPEDAEQADISRNAHLEGKTPYYNAEYRMRKKDGEYVWFNVRGKVLRDINGKNIRFAGSLIDITERKEFEAKLRGSYQELEATYEELTATEEEIQRQYDEILKSNEKIKRSEERLTHLAYYDTLTGLPNKLSLLENSCRAVFIPEKGKAALLFIDMDHFKYINDTMGHAFGDQVIIKVSKRLDSLLDERCTLYRISGDEFVIIKQDINGEADAEAEAEEFAAYILSGFRKELKVKNSVLYVNLSIGISMYPEHGKTAEELIKYADIAMYKVKETGRNNCLVYDQSLNEAFTERAGIEKYLHTALERGEFELYYQPQLDLKSNRITGMEALLRWKSPELGSVPPLKFIKIAEDTHLIIPLGTWVLKKACEFLRELHNKGFDYLTVSVNISILQLLQSDFGEIITGVLEDYGLKPCFLELEITETILMESFEAVGMKLEKLSELGVRIALDDFGKGYSSLNYLKQLPITTLKVDKSFIDNAFNSGKEDALTKHIITIGKSLGMCVIAEGVEKQEQLEFLVKQDCDKIQGYLYSKPVRTTDIVKLVEKDGIYKV